MKQNFEACLARVLAHEGGNDDDARDPGGRTSRGITQGVWDVWRAKRADLPADVWRAPQAEVNAIYLARYWSPLRCNDLPSGLDYAVFDFGVNSGISRSAKYLQKILGVEQDGEVGPNTLAAASKADTVQVISRLCDDRLAFLKGLNHWPTYGKGWSKRVAEVRSASLQMAASKLSPKPGFISELLSAIAELFRALFGRKPRPEVPTPSKEPPWMAEARKDIGFREKGVNRGIETFIEEAKVGSLGDPYCAIWLNAKLEETGFRGTRSALARSFETSPHFVRLPGPAIGAIGTMWRTTKTSGLGHCYFYVGENADGYLGLGANQDDAVNVRLQPKHRHTGWWWPKGYPLPKIGPVIASIKSAESKTEV